MPYSDSVLALSASQVLTADADSTYYIDTELTNPPWKKGSPLAVIVNIEAQTVASTGITFELCHRTSEPTTGTGTMATFVFLAADLAAGKQITLPLPQGMTMLRYFRLYYNITNGAERYTVSAYLSPYPAT